MDVTISTEKIENKYQSFISNIIKDYGYECVIEPYDGPQYHKYVGIFVNDEDSQGIESINYVNTDEEFVEVLKAETRFTIRITVWGGDAVAVAGVIRKSFESSTAESDMWDIIGFSGSDSVQNVSTEFKGKINRVATFNTYCYANKQYTNTIDYYDKVDVSIKNSDELENLDAITI